MFHNRWPDSRLVATAPTALAQTYTLTSRQNNGPTRFHRSVSLAVLLAACFAQVFAAAARAGVPEATPQKRRPPSKRAAPPPRHGRDVLLISEHWSFLTDPSNVGETKEWSRTAPGGARPVAVPSAWTDAAAPRYSGTAWYWAKVVPPDAWRGQTVRLHFDAVSESARIWLNGAYLGEHTGGATPFEFDVTKIVKIGAANGLAVRVVGSAEANPGVWQNVSLLAHDEAYIADVFPYGGPLGNLTAEIEINNTSDKSGDAQLDASIRPLDQTNTDIKKSDQALGLTPKRNVATMVINVPNKHLDAWTPEAPALYSLRLALRQENDILDTTETTVGFRDFSWKNGSIAINGAPFLPVAARLASARIYSDRAGAVAMIRSLKAAHTNVVWAEAPAAAVLEAADQEGMLVVEGPRAGLSAADAARELIELVRRDRSHTCVLAWNTRNLPEASAAVRALDPTRFTLTTSGDALYPPHADDNQTVPVPAGLRPR